MTRVVLGSDHAGFQLKAFLLDALTQQGMTVFDVGTQSPERIDYPPFCFAVGEMVARGEADWGIVMGGSGQGEQMAANKVAGVRAALCNDPYYARLARRDNDANVIAIGARVVAPEFALEILEAWTTTAFAGGRHQRRIALIGTYERPDADP